MDAAAPVAKSSASETSPDPGIPGYGSDESRSQLQGFTMFPGLSAEKKLKADGTEAKRRGPKPDSKPAMNRRQELNRQAQRTHRERKELYIKALEQEVLRLKDTYGTACRDRDAFAAENAKLRELLAQHNIHCPADLADADSAASQHPQHQRQQPSPLQFHSKSLPSSGGSYSGTTYEPADSEMSAGGVEVKHSPSSPTTSPRVAGRVAGPGSALLLARPDYNADVDQVGINFVLALERPCRSHMHMLCVRSQGADEQISGHALMASCPPVGHLIDNPDVQYPHKISGELPTGELLKLLDLSARLPLTGEITPVMAWAYLFRNPRFTQLNETDIYTINADLLAKVRCYGFGAVLEEFEVKDSLESVMAQKMDNLNLGMSV